LLIVQHSTRCRIARAYTQINGEAAGADYQFIGYLVVEKGSNSHEFKKL